LWRGNVTIESELRRKIVASQERERMWTWTMRCHVVLACMAGLVLIASSAGWIYALGPIAIVGVIGAIVCVVFAARHLFASFMA